MIDWRAVPDLPPSEVEWEELLVKLDIAPRALRVAAEDAPAGEARDRVLALAAAREAWCGECLARLRAGESVALDAGFEAAVESSVDALERYTRGRERNFAQLQRRGLDVWSWRSGDADPITAYQFAHLMADGDGRLLSELRALPR